jgi:putative ABC transport system ATP-binding protein
MIMLKSTLQERNEIMALLEITNVKKVYSTRLGGNKVQALNGVTFSVEKGEYVAIMGESGSGKTTLLNILASIDRATSGRVMLEGRDLSSIRQSELAAFRRDNLGFVFQDFNLLDTFTLQDNIFLPLVLSGTPLDEMKKRLEPLAHKLGIEEILQKYPYEVSGGEKQRAATARALITYPKIVLADEPTGALDSKASPRLLKLFADINAEGQTILMVTHSIQAASHAGRVMFIKDGCVFHQIYRGNASNEEMYTMITDALTVLQTGGMKNE